MTFACHPTKLGFFHEIHSHAKAKGSVCTGSIIYGQYQSWQQMKKQTDKQTYKQTGEKQYAPWTYIWEHNNWLTRIKRLNHQVILINKIQ